MLITCLAAWLAGCAEGGGWNLSNSELKERRPKSFASLAGPEFMSLVALDKKLDIALSYIHQDLAVGGIPPEPTSALEAIRYAGGYVEESRQKYQALQAVMKENQEEMEEMAEDREGLEPSETATLVALTAMKEPELYQSFDGYLNSVSNYLAAARQRGEYIKRNYDAIILGSSEALKNLDDYDEVYDKSFAAMAESLAGYHKVRNDLTWKARHRILGE